jgi:hypothetical protein
MVCRDKPCFIVLFVATAAWDFTQKTLGLMGKFDAFSLLPGSFPIDLRGLLPTHCRHEQCIETERGFEPVAGLSAGPAH